MYCLCQTETDPKSHNIYMLMNTLQIRFASDAIDKLLALPGPVFRPKRALLNILIFSYFTQVYRQKV
jgi:hypothetical protein